ncbi:MAG TPA: S8 family serine peptidase, partial [Prosthecobacter sp.]|nr:S8 family serine peptidase [Prosthecobacter sp.]
MTRTSQRSAAAAVLVLLGAGAFWWVAGDEGERNACSGQSGAPTRAASSTAPLSRSMAGAAASSAADVSTDAPAAVKDRFAASPVLEERQTSRQENGATKVSRVRLVRQEDLKYPIVRVVDELVTGPRGTRLQKQTAMVGDHVLISVEDPKLDETVILSRLKDAGATIRRKLPNSPTWLVAFPNPTVDTVPKAIHELTALKPWVRYAEPDYIVHAQATPNDPAFTNLWGMHNTGQNGGAADADIDAPEAWNISTGSAAVLVAVLDTGVDLTHPDLVDNLWVNPAEVANNGVDDDGNGYVDDVRGWDFVGNDNLPSDDHGHGTHCSGTIGAVGHNSTGVAGVCWDVSLVALKFLNAAGNGITSDGVEAVAYATRLGVSVTSNSWSGEEYSQSLKDAIDQANAAGILFVAAAGNSGVNLDLFGAYPAAYTSPNLISVAALTSTDTLADYSNYGLVTTDLGAPGSDIFSTLPGGGYGLKSGTSMAAPHVAGACALIKGRRPQLQHLQIKELIMRTTDATAALSAKTVSGGRLNLHNALAAADDILATPTTDLAASAPPGGPFAPASQTYTLTNYGGTSAPWTAEVDRSWITLSATSGTLAPTQSTQIQVSFNNYAEVLLPADHTATITIFNTVTGRTQRRQVKLRILPPALYSFTLDTDPGWQRTGQWSYGVPAGQGGTTFGKADPQSGATGSHVFGINLEGDYALEAGPPQYLVAGPFDLSAHHGTILRFQRWLNSDYQDWVYATLEVSTDQQVWHPVWDNGREMQIASKWTEVSYDISAHADGHSQVYVRWGHEIRNATAFPLSGWNLDDIQLIAVPDRQLHLSLPESVSEGQAGALAKIISVPAAATPLLVSLTSDRPGQEAAFPETVTIPANQEETTFTVAAIDDNQVDGTQTVTLTVSGPNRP